VRLWTEIVGAIAEAWQELRIHRTRVLLSLIGVGVAVAALTTVVAAGAIVQQAQTETLERQGGRPAHVTLNAYDTATGQQPDPELIEAAFQRVAERYDIGWTSRTFGLGARVQTPYGVVDAGLSLADPDWGVMHRAELVEGEWFTDRDALRLAPPVIVNEYLWRQLGSPPLSSHPTIDVVSGDRPLTVVVVGIVPSPLWDEYPQMHGLTAHMDRFIPREELQYQWPQLELWLPVDNADALMEVVRRDMAGALGEDVQVDAWRDDYLVWGASDPLEFVRLLVAGVGILILLLGALGLLNIALVTIKYRIREIGIRRSFGAGAGRVFFGVMMESVVATAVAGVAGVALSVLAVRILSATLLAEIVQDVPAFPLDAAIFGLVVSVAVGALAGLLPALFAVRVKVIDAIRY